MLSFTAPLSFTLLALPKKDRLFEVNADNKAVHFCTLHFARAELCYTKLHSRERIGANGKLRKALPCITPLLRDRHLSHESCCA